jgi:hypothetical protein
VLLSLLVIGFAALGALHAITSTLTGGELLRAANLAL